MQYFSFVITITLRIFDCKIKLQKCHLLDWSVAAAAFRQLESHKRRISWTRKALSLINGTKHGCLKQKHFKHCLLIGTSSTQKLYKSRDHWNWKRGTCCPQNWYFSIFKYKFYCSMIDPFILTLGMALRFRSVHIERAWSKKSFLNWSLWVNVKLGHFSKRKKYLFSKTTVFLFQLMLNQQ